MVIHKRFWLLGLTLPLLVLIGFFLGDRFLFKLSPAALTGAVNNQLVTDTVSNENKLSGSFISLSGSITPVLGAVEGEGTHKLVDASGKTLALLTSRKLDLSFIIPGLSVEVRGVISKKLGNGLMLVDVQSLRYRSSE